jgi:hypothetical protein
MDGNRKAQMDLCCSLVAPFSCRYTIFLSLSLSLVFSLTFSYNDFLGFSDAAPFIFAFEEREFSIV